MDDAHYHCPSQDSGQSFIAEYIPCKIQYQNHTFEYVVALKPSCGSFIFSVSSHGCVTSESQGIYIWTVSWKISFNLFLINMNTLNYLSIEIPITHDAVAKSISKTDALPEV